MSAGLDDEGAGEAFLGFGEQAGFEDHLDGDALGSLDDVAQFAENEAVIAFLQPTDIEDHVNFLGAEIDEGFSFVTFGVGVRGAEWEADDGGDEHAGVFETGGGEGDAGTVDADGVEVVLAGFGAQALDIVSGGVGFEEGVIDETGEFGGIQRHGGRIPGRWHRAQALTEVGWTLAG